MMQTTRLRLGTHRTVGWLGMCALLGAAGCTDAGDPVSPQRTADVRLTSHALDPAPATLAWQQQARELVGLNRRPVLAAERVYAYLSAAQYVAVTRADEQAFGDAELIEPGIGLGGRARMERERGAVTGASWAMLEYFFPAQQALLAERASAEALARGATHPEFSRGLAIGKAVGEMLVARASSDGFTAPFEGTIPAGPGLWLANGTPLGTSGAGVTPFLLDAADQFRAPTPPEYDSETFWAALAEVKAFSIDPEAANNARRWAYGAGTFTPAGHWNQLASSYVAAGGLNERAAAHVFALMHAAQFDAHVIACFESKYTYWYIRPSQVDPTIVRPIGLPNHPSYPSGHSCASSAATTVLAHFFPEHQAELTAQRIDAGLSRIYAGIHYRFDIDAAVQIGSSVAQLAIERDREGSFLAGL